MPRLSTIYTRLANLAYSNQDDEKALDYLAKLNVIGENSRNYLLAAEIYERDGKFNEAIEQVSKSYQSCLPIINMLKTDWQNY